MSFLLTSIVPRQETFDALARALHKGHPTILSVMFLFSIFNQKLVKNRKQCIYCVFKTNNIKYVVYIFFSPLDPFNVKFKKQLF